MNTFYIGRAIRYAWAHVRSSPLPFVVFGLVYGALEMARIYLVPGVGYDNESGIMLSPLEIGGSLIGFYVSMALYAVAVCISLALSRSQPVALPSLLTYPVLISSVIAVAVYYVLMICGLILLIVPGIYAALTYALIVYVVLDGSRGIRANFAESARLVKGSRFRVLGLSLAMMLLIVLLLACIGFVSGFIVAMAGFDIQAGAVGKVFEFIFSAVAGAGLLWICVAGAYAYRVLKGELPSDAAVTPAA